MPTFCFSFPQPAEYISPKSNIVFVDLHARQLSPTILWEMMMMIAFFCIFKLTSHRHHHHYSHNTRRAMASASTIFANAARRSIAHQALLRTSSSPRGGMSVSGHFVGSISWSSLAAARGMSTYYTPGEFRLSLHFSNRSLPRRTARCPTAHCSLLPHYPLLGD